MVIERITGAFRQFPEKIIPPYELFMSAIMRGVQYADTLSRNS